jgi:hypothetical protein
MPPVSCRTLQAILQIAGITLMAGQGLCADNATDSSSPANNLTRMNCGARIECFLPDGQTGHVSKLPASDPGAAALIMEDDTVTCQLQEGRTDFVVELPGAHLLDRLTFLNENALARGELKIAVSNERLRATSSSWVEVDGIVPFSHKRLFGVSLIGIEAKFVRLSFRVDKPNQAVASTSTSTDQPSSSSADQRGNSFSASALHDALNSRFATLHQRERILLTVNEASVGPLSASAR